MQLPRLNFRRLFQSRWWVLPLVVFFLGLTSLRLQDLDRRLMVATLDFVSLEASLRQLAIGEANQVKFAVALQRLGAASFSLSGLTVVAGLMTVFVAMLGVRSAEIPWWIQVVMVGYALYSGLWTLLTARLP
ncbi:MAG: hypothetical protein KatS3mg077_2019 [Candidatus Binatia bacterium]|nr:MAG: hypothetical protein KatS3mg077_2019 [Candidatus Binatia bacterium]